MPILKCYGPKEFLVPLEGERITIGRHPEVDIVIENPSVSRHHAELIAKGGGYVIRNLSRYGTLVNGKAIDGEEGRPLASGDLITLGKLKLRYFEDGEEPSEEEPPAEILREVDSRELEAQFRTTIEFRKLSEAEQRLSLLYQLAEALRSLSDLSGMLERFMGVIFSTLDPERAYIGIFDPKLGWVYEVAKTEHGKKRESFRKSTQIVEWVRREGKAFITGNIQQSGDLAWTRATLNEGIRSAMCSPIIDIEGKDIGVIYIDDRKRAHFFKEEDLRFFVFLGLILGKFISNALLHDLLRRRMIAMEAQQPVEELVFGNSAAMQALKQQFEELAGTDFTLLLLGETGTGKTIFARKIHERSGRKGPFVEVNCSAIPENLFESELFGYAPRSGIANADPRGRKGKFELADGGTLFLDEIGDMSYDQQARLLKALEEKQFYPIGATRPVKVDVRIIAATNRDLKEEISQKCFREDLFYRLSEVPPFTLPPLRERKEDLPILCEHILYQLLREEFPRKRITGFSPAAMAALSAYDWPGNFRELKQFLRFALIAAPAGRHELEPTDFPQEISAAPPGASALVEIRLTKPDEAFSPTDLAKRDKVVEVLRASRSNREAARKLGITPQWLSRLIRQFGIEITRRKG